LRNNGHSFRLICTSDEDLEKLTDEGRFNDELFYRVATLPVTLPPLRERIEDLPILVKHFTRGAANPNFDAALVEFAEDAMAQLRAYRWPGNLAELEQVVSKIVSTCESRVIAAQQLPLRLREPDQWPKLEAYLAGQEKQYIEMVLHACGGDKGRAARVLGVGLSKLS
jgi:DNA-binding NtrC family response regulator